MINKGLYFSMLILLLLVAIISISNDSMANWTNWLFFSNKQYKEKIEVETYLMDTDQICALFSKNEKKQLSYDKLSNKALYLVICLKNVGDHAAWGSLLCVNGYRTITIDVPHLRRKMQDFSIFLIPVSGIFFTYDNGFPVFVTKWKELYTK